MMNPRAYLTAIVLLLAATSAATAQHARVPAAGKPRIDERLTADAYARLAPVAARVERCLRRHRLALSEANAPQLTSCVCAGPAQAEGRYCWVGDGFVAFSPGALPRGIFRDPGLPSSPVVGFAYVPTPVEIPPEFDRNFGAFGPSYGPRARGWHLIGFCPRCD